MSFRFMNKLFGNKCHWVPCTFCRYFAKHTITSSEKISNANWQYAATEITTYKQKLIPNNLMNVSRVSLKHGPFFYCFNGAALVNGDSNKFSYHVLYVKSSNCLNTRIVKIWTDFDQNYPERFRISVGLKMALKSAKACG